jgi:hypothetical protein
MSGETTGTLCLVKKGTYASPTDLLGQGNMSIENVGELIPIDNKSSGEWIRYLANASTSRGQNVTIEFDSNDDPAYKQLLADARTQTTGQYVIDMISYYYEGTYIPRFPSETANKNELLKATIIFVADGEVTDGVPVP